LIETTARRDGSSLSGFTIRMLGAEFPAEHTALLSAFFLLHLGANAQKTKLEAVLSKGKAECCLKINLLYMKRRNE